MEETLSSMDLWTTAKVVGRECATVNKEFLLCKNKNGPNPDACMKQGDLVTACVSGVVKTAKAKFPVEFDNFQKCLDYNDFRYYDCRPTEKAFNDAWNKMNGH